MNSQKEGVIPALQDEQFIEPFIESTPSSNSDNYKPNRKNSEAEYVVYPYRWLMQFAFCMALASTGMIQIGFSSIALTVEILYDTSLLMVSLQSLLFVWVSFIATFYVMQISKKGLRLTLVIGAVCIIVGVWLRELVEITGNFNVICIGTSIVAFGQSFFYISSTKLSSLWFGPKERSLSTSLGVLSLAFGSIIGFILPSIMIKEEDAVFKENGRKKLSKYMLVQNIIVTISASLIIIFARDGPPTPPSKDASSNDKQFSVMKELKVLIKNKNYIYLCIGYSFVHANNTALAAIISSLTRDYGYTSTDNGLFGGVYIISGIIGSVIAGLLLDKFQKFKTTLILTIIIAIVANLLIFLTLPSGKVWLFTLNIALNGMGMVPISPISYAFAVELTFPTPEHVSNGLIILPSKIYTGLLGLLVGYLSEYHDPRLAIVAFLLNAIISLIGALYIKEDLRRLKESIEQYEDEKSLNAI